MSTPDYVIYTDGSFRLPGDHTPTVVSKSNFGAWAAIIIQEGTVTRELTGYEWNTSINRMELTAIIEAISGLPSGRTINIYSDSKYCVNSINAWIAMWERSNWITAGTGQPVLNRDLMEKIHALKSIHNILAHHVKGHSGDQYNERADELAQALTIQMAAGSLLPENVTLQSAPIAGPVKIERPPAQNKFNPANHANRFRKPIYTGKKSNQSRSKKTHNRPF